jgi:ketosteroid isomerase-like protein
MTDIFNEILTLEQNALKRWGNGDPDGFLEISAPDVGYFDPFLERRLDGIESLRNYYEALRGKIRIERQEILEPRVQVIGEDVAVLTFRFASFGGNEDALLWNCSEVYRRDPEGWRIIHTHWAFMKSRRG